MLPISIKAYFINQDAPGASSGGSADRRFAPYLFCPVYFAVFCGYHLWIAGFHNYAVETFNISVLHTGYLYSVAALPGTFAFLIGMIARKLRLGALMIFACSSMGFGLIGIGLAPSCYFLWPGVLSIGLGFTCFYPIISSICIQHSDSRTVGTAIGHLKSYGPLAAVTVFILITICTPHLSYRSFFLISGGLVVMIGFWALTDSDLSYFADRPGNLQFKKDLWPYYLLNFLAGCRSAGITAFFLLLLVKQHGLLMHETAAVVLIGNICSFIGFRLIGHFADRYNPPKVLSFLYLGVSLIFLGFCFINTSLFLILFYFFDSALFGVSVVTDSHLKRVSRAKDTVGDVASGFTLFHLGKAIFPLAGGILWSHSHQQATFLVISILAALAVWVSRKLIRPQPDKRHSEIIIDRESTPITESPDLSACVKITTEIS